MLNIDIAKKRKQIARCTARRDWMRIIYDMWLAVHLHNIANNGISATRKRS